MICSWSRLRSSASCFLRNTDQHVHMVYHKVAFQYPTLPLHGELSENLAQMLPELIIECLPSVLRNPYYMVLAVPYCVT